MLFGRHLQAMLRSFSSISNRMFFVRHRLLQARSRSISSISNNAEFIHKPDFRPRRIVLLRHGESLGNVDESAYVTTADWRIPLTNLGKEQAVEAGRCLREKISEEDAKIVFYYSPYLRTKQTLDELLPYFSDSEILSCLEGKLSYQDFYVSSAPQTHSYTL
jgi:hypothetical protein